MRRRSTTTGELEGGGGFDREGGHVGGGESLVSHRMTKDEVDAVGPELVIGRQGRDDLVVVQIVGVADEER